MSSILAMTEDARRRVEGTCTQINTHRNPLSNLLENADSEMLLLIAVILVLLNSKANSILLLAILYVTM